MSYLRVLSRIAGSPLFISEDKLRAITEAVTLPLMAGHKEEIKDTPSMAMATQKPKVSGTPTLAIIEVFDSLVSKNAAMGSGFTSYESISANIDKAVAQGVTDIGFYIDSPGGEVSGLFSLTSKIRGLADYGISTFAFADGMATSAAFAIMAACDTAYATDTSVVGSIAAIMVHMETSVADAASGRTYTIFRSKSEKALADSHTPLTETAITKIETMLASMDNSFNNDIALSRPALTVKAIIDLKGSEFMAAAALDLGLIDNIALNIDSVISTHFSSTNQTRGASMTLEELKAKLEMTEASIIAMQAEHTLALASAVDAERTRCVTLLQAGETLRTKPELALGHISKGYSSEMSLEIMTAVASASTQSAAITGAIGVAATADLQNGTVTDKKETLAGSYKMATGRASI